VRSNEGKSVVIMDNVKGEREWAEENIHDKCIRQTTLINNKQKSCYQ